LATNPERGIYRTTDGGKNWSKVLYKDENSGGIDLSLDPTNPNVIFASLWQARRTPWGMDSGGPGSGLVSQAPMAHHMEAAERPWIAGRTLGRIGLAVAYNGNACGPW